MRLAAIVARILAEDIKTTSTSEVFRAATVGGATALGRDDIGRLAPGAKADFVLVDLKNPFMMPVRDPLRSLIYTAADRAIRDVYIAGTRVVRSGEMLTMDHAGALEALTEAQQRMLSSVRQRDYKGRKADEVIPLSLSLLP
jgi:cytosine/adenosine deaminase-related metal-dependent hydrolase